jgi:uncharacterized protein (DUF58 family)
MERPDRVDAVWHPAARRGAIWLIAAGIAAAALGGAHPPLWPLLVFILTFPVAWILIASALSLVMARQLAFELVETPSLLRAMLAGDVSVRVRNQARFLPVFDLRLDGALAAGVHGLDSMAENAVPILAAGEEAARRWVVIVRSRAPLRIGPFRAVVELPGSIFRAVAVFDVQKTVAVLPALYHLRPIVTELLAGRRLAAGRLAQVPAGLESYIGAREYRPGDNPKLIHRVLSLRARNYPYELYVREYEDPTEDDVSVVLDTTRPAPAEEALLRYRFEKAVAFTAALCRTLTGHKLKVRFLCQRGPGVVVELRLRPLDTDLNALETMLGGLEMAGDRETILRTLVAETKRRGPAVIFVSLHDRAEEAQQRRLPIVSITPNLVPVFTREVVWR